MFAALSGSDVRASEGDIVNIDVVTPPPTREIVLSIWSALHGLAMLQIGRQLGAVELGDDLEQAARIVGANVLRGLLR